MEKEGHTESEDCFKRSLIGLCYGSSQETHQLLNLLRKLLKVSLKEVLTKHSVGVLSNGDVGGGGGDVGGGGGRRMGEVVRTGVDQVSQWHFNFSFLLSFLFYLLLIFPFIFVCFRACYSIFMPCFVFFVLVRFTCCMF